MKRLAITFLLLILLASVSVAWLSYTPSGKKFKALHLPPTEAKITKDNKAPLRVESKLVEAKEFVSKNKYNSDYCFLLDLNMPSNQKRFFIYDLKKDSIMNSGLVTHGNCNQYWLDKVKYDNVVGCGCSSVGKYKAGYAYFGRFGLAFKLHGLDVTNDKAFERFVVLHAHDCVPDTEVEDEICQSNGCPTVSPEFLKELEPMIKDSKKPVLLWVIE